MLPWRELREPTMFAFILLAMAVGYLLLTFLRVPAPTGDSLHPAIGTPTVAGISTSVGYPPVRVAVPPTSIFIPGTYTADRPNDSAAFLPRYTFVAVPPPVFKSIHAPSPQNP